VVLDGRMLHPELAAGVSSMANPHGLRVGDVDLGVFIYWVPAAETRSSPTTTALCSVSSESTLH